MEERRFETPRPASERTVSDAARHETPRREAPRARRRSIRPYKLRVAQPVLADLRRRLDRVRWPDEIAGSGWQYGTNLAYLQKLVEYWRSQFDWRAQEARLNSFSHYRTEIDSLGIHFIHERGKGPDPIPMIITHGWPGSIAQMLKLIPLLTDPESHGAAATDSFDVVVPSLPGFGFSDRPTAPGFTKGVADTWAHLMRALGYERFAAHGGDIGAGITEQLARSHPNSLIGIHLTEVPYFHIFAIPPPELSEAEQEYLEAGRKWQQEEGAYAMIQGTRPQTLAYGLNDSPAGLAAWIVEKFRAWSDCDGDVEKRFTQDELLTNLMIYWATGTIGSSMRWYYELMHDPPAAFYGQVKVPAGFAMFPKDLVPAPRDFAERIFDVQRWTQMPRGGHFAAMEEPQLLAEDIRAFFRPLRMRGRVSHPPSGAT